ncbi:hypothetical protein J2Z48_001915 [Croceifilum oryzae]|uniref:DUF1878 domain-containing protein n=1 Tax=Croceifilum oryzae TaxID=1553429 RepID=A0AAJ1TIV3_9BACL|nr:DUF1878 family protein [Croceifilum oryzae]MDQ0417742.1 hypothetical protein [Croceifilum oryzae]
MEKNVADELSKLRYHMKLMQQIVFNPEKNAFFMSVIDYDISENQVRAILKVMSAFSYRLEKKVDEPSKNDPDPALIQFGISSEELYSDQKPSLDEFSKYLQGIYPKSMNPEYLLKSLKVQSMFTDVCEYLLD